MNTSIALLTLTIGCVETNLKSINDPVTTPETTFEYSVADYTVELSEGEEIEYGESEAQIYEQVWNTPLNPKTDFLFILDKSSSMSFDFTIIDLNFHYFLENLNQNANDWRLIFFDQQTACATHIATPDGSNIDEILNLKLHHGTDDTARNNEKLLTFANNVFINTINNGCNNGIFRTDALLNIIMISDEPEQSEEAVTSLIDQFIPYTNGIDKLRITAVFDEEENTGRYEEAANYTNGQWFYLGDRNSWDQGIKLNEMADTGVVHEYQLDYEPVIDSIQVFINNVESNQWTYNTYTQSVIIDNNVLQPNDTIKITFEML